PVDQDVERTAARRGGEGEGTVEAGQFALRARSVVVRLDAGRNLHEAGVQFDETRRSTAGQVQPDTHPALDGKGVVVGAPGGREDVAGGSRLGKQVYHQRQRGAGDEVVGLVGLALLVGDIGADEEVVVPRQHARHVDRGRPGVRLPGRQAPR